MPIAYTFEHFGALHDSHTLFGILLGFATMIGENRESVTDEPVEFKK